MHEVLNKHKDRTVDVHTHPGNHSGFTKNNIHIATFSCLPNVKPIHQDILTPAYGFKLYEKLSKLISGNSLVLKKKSLKELCKLYRVSHQNIVKSLQANIVDSLFLQVESTEDFVREFAYHALTLICSIKFGRECVLRKDYSEEFLRMCNDDNLRVRHRALSILVNLGTEREGCKLLFKRHEEFISLFLKQSDTVDDVNVKIACLENLINMLKIPEVYEHVIKKGVFRILSKFLKGAHPSVKVQGVVCRYIGQLCYRKEGVQEAVRYEMIDRIVDLLDLYRSEEFREHASTALMFITLDIVGKKQFIKTDYGVQLISGMVKNEKEEMMTKINGLKIVCNVSEEPEGYEKFGKLIPNIEKQIIELKENKGDPLLMKNLEMTRKRLIWKP